jgi:outer membrane protein TolC
MPNWPRGAHNGNFAFLAVILSASAAFGQSQTPSRFVSSEQTSPQQRTSLGAAPITITFHDALARAQINEPTLLAALNAANVAHEDAVQAGAARYPVLGIRSEYLNTQGNGRVPSGRYVTNDGVHVYREWATFHQDVTPATFTGTAVQHAMALEAVARARADIARRGLVVTVTKTYYGLIAAQRKYATAQLALEEARRSLTVTQQLERGGEVAHSDVVKAEIQVNAQDQAFREAKLAMDTARLDLAVLLSPNFNLDFQVVDDLHLSPVLPTVPELQSMALRRNPDLQAAMENLRSARLDITIARQAFLPTLTIDLVWGLEANQIAWNAVDSAFPQLGPIPAPGYFLTGSLTFPIWDWGSRKSKVRQAVLKREQANVELSAAQRQLQRNLAGYYQEAETARDQLALLQQTVDLATENLRLNRLRYQASEATILELVDAQTTLNQARNALDDGLVRYRVALANLQTVTGPF